MKQEDLMQLRPEAEAEFRRRYPGVRGVAVGYRVRAGQLTDEIVLRVYVTEKKPPSALKTEEIIPAQYKNVPTDVLTIPGSVPDVDTTPCADRSQHSPLVGGITISSMKTDSSGIGLGTIGFFATYSGDQPPYNIALVTNQHVVAAAGGAVGDTIYQPEWATQPDGTLAPVSGQGNVVGTVLKMAPKADDANGNYVDAASVKLNICISSWCHTNCGVSFTDQIMGLGINNSNAIADVKTTVNIGDTVYKVGRTTGRTVGKVTAVALVVTVNGTDFHNIIEIQAVSMQTANNCGGSLRFDDEGDSGAALIDAQANLVGLVFGHDPASPNLTHACHIQPVLDALGVVPITVKNPVQNNPAAEGMAANVPAIIDGRPNQTPQLRAKFFALEEGQRIGALVEMHRHEVVHLVNHNRRVLVTWHRNHGPEFLNRALNNARDDQVKIPPEVQGVSREALLRNMARVLAEQGSPGLRAVIELHREEILAHAASCESLHDLVGELREKELV